MPVVLAPVLIGWSVLLLALLLWALSQSGKTALHSLFTALSSVLPSIPVVSRFVGHGVQWLIDHTLRPISEAALGMEGAIAGWFSHVAVAVERGAFSAFYTAVRTYDALWKLRHAIIPNLIRGVTLPIKIVAHGGLRVGAHAWHAAVATGILAKRIAYEANARAWEAEHTAARALRKAESITLPRIIRIPGEATRVVIRVAAPAVAAPLPWTGRELGALEGSIGRLWHRVRSLPSWLTMAGVGAVAVWALGKIGASWLRCSNWQKLGKAGCRMPGHWLDSLLGLVTDFFILSNICTILPWLERGFSDVAEPLFDQLAVVDAGLRCSAAGLPPQLAGEPVVYPTVLGTDLGGL